MPAPQGRYKIGLHAVGDATDPSDVAAADAHDAAALSVHVRELLPKHDPKPVRMATCLYTVTPDENFLIAHSAGSALLVLQTVLPPLLRADGASSVVVEGGTHNPWAPPFEALERSFAPVLARTGARLELVLDRPGFYPAGGGRVTAHIVPAVNARPLELLERGAERSRRAEAVIAHLPEVVGKRELEALGKRQPWVREAGTVLRMDSSAGPGNLIHVTLAFDEITEVFTGFGEKGVRAEDIGKQLGTEVALYLTHGAPVGEHLADQLMVPLALLAGGRYRATGLSRHATTNAAVVNAFLPDAVRTEVDDERGITVQVGVP
jgi:RNA 3'-terminal phosphate cyclase (ATP)